MVRQLSKQTMIFDYIQVIAGASLVALGYNMFLLPSRLAAGGVSGISTLLFELFLWNPALVQISINLPLFILGLFILGKDFSAKTLVGTTFVPLVIWLTQGIDLHVHDAMLGAIYGGIVLGVGLGIVYRGGGSTGGTAMIAQLLKKFTGLSSGFRSCLSMGLLLQPLRLS